MRDFSEKTLDHSIFHGHLDFYRQDLSDLPNQTIGTKSLGMLTKILAEKAEPKTQNEIRFQAVFAPPYINIERKESGFEVSGPSYSVMVETARNLNCSLTGFSTESENVI